MGWGSEPHEGFADGRRVDGTWTQGTWLGGRGLYDDPVAVQATCSCGWRSERMHEIGQPPERQDTEARAAWAARRDHAEENDCYADWQAEHLQPLLGYEPHTQLILGRNDGGERHYLDGRPVNAGSALELLLAGDTWVKVRYEWSWLEGEPPTAHLSLGGPHAAEQLDYNPIVSFPLPPRAVLRWPASEQAPR